MATQSEAGHHLEVLFTENGRTVEIDVDETDTGAFAVTLVQAIGKDDPGEAERVIQAGVAAAGGVEQVR
jgi:tellurite resistance protein